MENMCMAFENRCLGYTATKPKLPLLIVTGFLGSGKTTLLRHLLCNKANLRMAVLGTRKYVYACICGLARMANTHSS